MVRICTGFSLLVVMGVNLSFLLQLLLQGPIFLHGLEGQVDVMIEAKAKEKALLKYRATLPAAGAAVNGLAAAAPVLAVAEEGQADVAEPMEAEAA